MKKIVFTIFTFMLCSIGFIKAQALDTIPNGDFERWQGIGKAEEKPQGWDTLGGIAYPVNDVAYVKGTDFIDRPVYDGKTALSLSCRTIGASIYFGRVACHLRMRHKDPYLVANLAYMQGAFPEYPIFELICWNSRLHDTLIKGAVTIPNGGTTTEDTAEPWLTYSVGLNWSAVTDTATPDSCIILLQNAASIVYNNQFVNPSASELYVERIWFSNTTEAGISSDVTPANGVSIYPNPFSNKTTIRYNLTGEGEVNLSVYDMQGREIKNLVNGNQSPGLYTQTFDGNGLSNGVYMYRLQTSSGVQTGKLILNK